MFSDLSNFFITVVRNFKITAKIIISGAFGLFGRRIALLEK